MIIPWMGIDACSCNRCRWCNRGFRHIICSIIANPSEMKPLVKSTFEVVQVGLRSFRCLVGQGCQIFIDVVHWLCISVLFRHCRRMCIVVTHIAPNAKFTNSWTRK
jgi:hypothetical protein